MTTEDFDRLSRLNKALQAVRAVKGSPDLEKALVKAIYELENYGYGGNPLNNMRIRD